MTIQQQTRVEHIEVQTPDGAARMHVLHRFAERDTSGSHDGLDWRAAPKSRLRRILDAFKWNRQTDRR